MSESPTRSTSIEPVGWSITNAAAAEGVAVGARDRVAVDDSAGACITCCDDDGGAEAAAADDVAVVAAEADAVAAADVDAVASAEADTVAAAEVDAVEPDETDVVAAAEVDAVAAAEADAVAAADVVADAATVRVAVAALEGDGSRAALKPEPSGLAVAVSAGDADSAGVSALEVLAVAALELVAALVGDRRHGHRTVRVLVALGDGVPDGDSWATAIDASRATSVSARAAERMSGMVRGGLRVRVCVG